VNASRVLVILRKDVGVGPRSAIVMWAVVMPLLMTFLVQVVFGSLFERQPRLGVVDAGSSQMVTALEATPGIEVRRLDDSRELMRQVAAHDLDGGLVLAAGFDEAVRSGERPVLALYIAGESLASDRVILTVTALDLVREVEGRRAPVEVELVGADDAATLTMSQRLVPLLVLLALLVAGVFVTAFSFVEERERGTLAAVLVTPTSLGEMLVAKGLLGLLLAMVMTVVTLAMNRALGANPLALLLGLLVGATMAVLIGLLYGLVARDTKSLYTLFKSLNIILIGPVVFYLFPDWPQWIARLFPTYWFLDPIFEVTTHGAGLREVGGDLLVGLLVCAALAGVVAWLARRASGRAAAA
jgi:ABC-2 type transport system permease protein